MTANTAANEAKSQLLIKLQEFHMKAMNHQVIKPNGNIFGLYGLLNQCVASDNYKLCNLVVTPTS